MVDPTRQALGGRAREHRGARRARVRVDAAYEDDDRQVFVVASDLSETGAWLQAPDPPEVGRSARLAFQLPGVRALVRLRATVVRRRQEEPSGFAVRFSSAGPPAGMRAAIRGYVREVLNSPE